MLRVAWLLELTGLSWCADFFKRTIDEELDGVVELPPGKRCFEILDGAVETIT